MMRLEVTTEADACALINALRVAAERFDQDGDAINESTIHHEAKCRLVTQFRQQASQARKWADDLEEMA